jgi:cyclopropane-fatty-acyl-phospholipid synthase
MTLPLQKIITNRYGGRNVPVTLVLPDGGRVPLSSDPELEILARTWRGLKALSAPAMGALARAYVHNDIDFTGSARRALGIAENMVGEVAHGRDSLRARWRIWRHQHRSNRANIRYHYDVSNAFYRLWLDRQLVYSCAYFATDDTSLDAAQAGKVDHICRKLRLQPGDRFLDIGCGWGALLFHAAERYGVEAYGITLSKNQFEHVKAEVAARGLTGRVKVELRDYLDLPEDALYDKIASVGMFEHVGIKRFPQYFGKILRVLKPGGLVLNHGITHNALGADSLGSGIGDLSRSTFSPVASSRRLQGDRRNGGGRARSYRRRGVARALRENAVALVRRARSERRFGASRSGRGEVPRLAHLSRRICARVRTWLAVAVAASGRQAPAGWPLAASAHASVHVSLPGRHDD